MRWYCLPGLHGSSRPDNADGGSNFRAADGVGGGESVGREVRTETIGHGAGAITRTTIIETRTTPDGKTHTSRTVKESRGSSSDGAFSVQRPETGPAEQVRCFTLISSFFYNISTGFALLHKGIATGWTCPSQFCQKLMQIGCVFTGRGNESDRSSSLIRHVTYVRLFQSTEQIICCRRASKRWPGTLEVISGFSGVPTGEG